MGGTTQTEVADYPGKTAEENFEIATISAEKDGQSAETSGQRVGDHCDCSGRIKNNNNCLFSLSFFRSSLFFFYFLRFKI
jgi:hypothetical protein